MDFSIFPTKTFIFVMLVFSMAQAMAEEDAWPMWRRDTQGGPVPGEPKLADPQITKQTRLWVSEADIPPGRRGSGDDGRHRDGLADMERPLSGGYASPIAAAGMVFQYHYRPSGSVYDIERARQLGLSQEDLLVLRGMNSEEREEWHQEREREARPLPGDKSIHIDDELADLLGDTPGLLEEEAAPQILPLQGNLVRGHERWLVAATDVITAMDAETGKTVWQTDLTDQGLNFGFFGKGGGGRTPVYHDGMIIAYASSAQIFGVEAQTGEVRWTYNVQPRHERHMNYLRDALEGVRMAARFNRDMLVGLVAADGIVIVDDQHAPNSYIALDVHTGEEIWVAPAVGSGGTTPKLWRHGGKTYVLGIQAHHLTLLDLASGEQIWQSNYGHRSPTCAFNLGISDDYVVMAAGSLDEDGRKLSGFSIDLKGLHKLWTWGPIDEFRSNALIVGDRAYMTVDEQLRCFHPATGEILAEVPIGNIRPAGGNPFIAYYGGWIFTRARGVGEDGEDGFFVMHADPEHMASTQRFFAADLAQPYYTLIFPAFANSTIFFRTDHSYKMEAYRLR